MKKLSDYSLTRKLLLIPSVAILGFGGIMMYSYMVMSDSNSLFNNIRDSDFPILEAADKNLNRYDAIVVALDTAAATGEIGFLNVAKGKATEILSSYETLENLDAKHKGEIENLKSSFNTYFALATDIARQMAAKTGTPSFQHILKMRTSRDLYLSGSVAYRDAAKKYFHETVNESIRKSERAKVWSTVIGILMLLLIIALTLLVRRDIAKRKVAENALELERNKLAAAFENPEIGFVLCNGQGGDVTMNAAALKLHEFSSIEDVYQNIEEKVNDWELRYLDGQIIPYEEWPMLRAIRGDFLRDFEFHYHNLKTGTKWICNITCAPVRNSAGEVTLIVQTLLDITKRSQAEENLRITASVFDNTHDAIVVTNASNTIMDVNPAFTRITGYSRDEAIGRNPKVLNSGRHDKAFFAQMWQSLGQNKAWRGEIWNRRKSGEIYAELLSISAICDNVGKVQRYVAVFSDISHIKEHEAELSRVAYYDALTGIPNRVLLADRMKHAIAQTSREQNMMAICYLDLDGFKPINDTMGHDAGDMVLIEVAKRIGDTIRGGDTVARMGGDEFVVLLLGLERGEECLTTLERMLTAISLPITVKNKPTKVSASIGVSIYPLDDENPDILLRHADQAMYVAKQSGKNRFYIYGHALN